MRIIVLLSFLLTACSFKHNNKTVEHKKMSFTEAEILHKLDLAFNDIPDSDFPAGDIEDIKYNFFPDLEHGYCETAGSKIHLYADKSRWAIVFEKCGYYNRSFDARIELIYIGNCIDYVIEKFPFRISTIRTDRGHEFQARFHWHVEDQGIQHVYIKPRTPQLNGKVERSHRTDETEFYQLLTYTNDVDLSSKLEAWENFYNYDRPHMSLQGKTPYEVMRSLLK